jgi:hypothetical protein
LGEVNKENPTMTEGNDVKAAAVVKMYEKTSCGLTVTIPREEGDWILDHYQGDGRRFVESLRRISSDTYEIVLKRGERIRLTEVSACATPSYRQANH